MAFAAFAIRTGRFNFLLNSSTNLDVDLPNAIFATNVHLWPHLSLPIGVVERDHASNSQGQRQSLRRYTCPFLSSHFIVYLHNERPGALIKYDF